MNDQYDSYSGVDNMEIVLGGAVSGRSCSECPGFDACDAMDNPDGWFRNEYLDD